MDTFSWLQVGVYHQSLQAVLLAFWCEQVRVISHRNWSKQQLLPGGNRLISNTWHPHCQVAKEEPNVSIYCVSTRVGKRVDTLAVSHTTPLPLLSLTPLRLTPVPVPRLCHTWRWYDSPLRPATLPYTTVTSLYALCKYYLLLKTFPGGLWFMTSNYSTT